MGNLQWHCQRKDGEMPHTTIYMKHPPSQPMPVLKADSLIFGHAGSSGLPLFKQLSIVLLPGVTWVGGDESSGKTTFLHLLAGTVKPEAFQGQLRIHGASLAENPAAYRHLVAWLDPRDTARDQQTAHQIFAELRQSHAGCNPDVLQLHITGLSLAPHLDKALYMMSSGTRRKVLMAAAMATTAPVILLDQPFMALDQPSTNYLLQVLGQAAQQLEKAWVVADYDAPPGIALSGTVALRR